METKSQNLAFTDTPTAINPTGPDITTVPLLQLGYTPVNDDDTSADDDNSISEDELTGEPVVFYASPEQVAAIQSRSAMKSALKMSGSVLVFAFITVFLLWYRMVFELGSTSTLQTIAILLIALVQTSIFANTLIVLASVIHGKLGGQLQITITPTTTNKTCRESLLFSDTLCQGSYKAGFGVVVAMAAVMAYHYVKQPVVFDTITLVMLTIFFIANFISIAVIKAAHTKVKAALLIVKKEV